MRNHSQPIQPPLGHIERPRIAREHTALTGEDLERATILRNREKAQAEKDVDMVAKVLAGHGIPDRSAAEHVVDALRAAGRLS